MKFCLLIIWVLFSCNESYTPKPRAFFKFNLPKKIYSTTDINCNFSFERPVYSKMSHKESHCSFDLVFPNQNSTLHVTYVALENDLFKHIEASRNLAYKHNRIADAISEVEFENNEFNVFGLMYNYDGNTATSTQFYLTDSVNHFFRGALYLNSEITDSLLPINNFLKKDIVHIIETFRWKEQ